MSEIVICGLKFELSLVKENRHTKVQVKHKDVTYSTSISYLPELVQDLKAVGLNALYELNVILIHELEFELRKRFGLPEPAFSAYDNVDRPIFKEVGENVEKFYYYENNVRVYFCAYVEGVAFPTDIRSKVDLGIDYESI